MITLYADGSSSLKSGYCGWAVHGEVNGKQFSFCGYLKGTNQVAELTAMMYAMRMIPRGGIGTVITDSQYAIKSMTEWWNNWTHNGFRNAAGNVISNYDLIHRAREIYVGRRVNLQHVRGHTGVEGNEICDKLAKSARFVGEGKLKESELLGAVLIKA